MSLSLRYHRVDDTGFVIYFVSLILRYHRLDDTGILDSFGIGFGFSGHHFSRTHFLCSSADEDSGSSSQ